jgi:C4-dicarboxylate transporter DctM subunit
VGRFPGGLAQVNVLQSVVFASMSGSCPGRRGRLGQADADHDDADGKYTPGFAAALSAVSSVIGPILPPSIPLVLYALVSGTSIGYLFIAGVLPGLLLGVVQMALIWWLAGGAASRWSRACRCATCRASRARPFRR